MRAREPVAATLAYKFLARIQSTEIWGEMFSDTLNCRYDHDQIVINAILERVSDERGSRSLSWGIYNPFIAYTGMYAAAAPLSVRLNHATASTAKLEEKIRFMDIESSYIYAIQEACAVSTPQQPVPFD